MSNALEIDGKMLHPIKDAAQVVSYSRDYVTRLAREHKIRATYVGRQWFVDIDSLQAYAETSAMEQEVRKKQLSEERKREQQLHAAAERAAAVQGARASALPLRAAAVASLVLSFGVLSGYLTHQLMTFDAPAPTMQVAASAKVQSEEARVAVADTVPSVPAAPGAEPTPVAASAPSESIEPMNEVRNGVLLFPPSATSTPEELFSDNVLVEERADGTKWIHKRSADGTVIGDPIPFIEVPITADTR